MRGADSKQEAMFSYDSPESRVPVKHPLRPICAMISEVLAQMDGRFEKLYSRTGRPSIAPERLIPERVNEFGTPGVMRSESKQVWSRVVSSPVSVD